MTNLMHQVESLFMEEKWSAANLACKEHHIVTDFLSFITCLVTDQMCEIVCELFMADNVKY